VLRDRERRRLAVIAAGCRSTSVANSHLPSHVDGSHERRGGGLREPAPSRGAYAALTSSAART
jgi:hypothetical protein